MAVPYVVRKKADLTSGERKELWYGVPKKLIDPIRNREFAEYMEKRSGFHRGQIDGILTEMVDAIRSLLSIGQPVTIEGLGTFHTSLTSPGSHSKIAIILLLDSCDFVLYTVAQHSHNISVCGEI